MDSEEERMLAALGMEDVEELFSDIPQAARIGGLDLPPGVTELETLRRVHRILSKNRVGDRLPTFLGAGVYDHFVPSAVSAIASRSEFSTSYTPYQAEISQGILTALFEYQSLVCELTGMDAANSSMYDGSSALGEAALMAARITRKSEIAVPANIHWEKRQVLESYCRGPGLRIVDVDYDRETGRVDLDSLAQATGPETAAVYYESPCFFGVLEAAQAEIREATEGLLIAGVNPLSLAIARPPGDFGADIVVGEGQVLGSPMNFGGPLLGVFACRQEHVRKMPGRVIGLTRDSEGRRAFCMTLQSREQHIRRERATSNICTNQALLAVAAAAYLAVLGGSGLRRLALQNLEAARGLASRINALDRCRAPLFSGEHFNEFVVQCDADVRDVNAALLERGLHGGLPLRDHFPELGNAALYAVTEMHTQEQLDALVKTLEVAA